MTANMMPGAVMSPAARSAIQNQAQSPLQPARTVIETGPHGKPLTAHEAGSSAPPALSGEITMPLSPLVMFRLPKHRQIGGAGRPQVPALVMRTYEGSDAVDLVVFFGYEDIRGFQRIRRLTPETVDEGGWYDPPPAGMLEAMNRVEGLHERIDEMQAQITTLAAALSEMQKTSKAAPQQAKPRRARNRSR